MKRILITICLMVGMLLGGSGCGQKLQKQIRPKYKLESKDGIVILKMKYSQKSYNLVEDIKYVWKTEKEFRQHITLWSIAIGYTFFGLPFTNTPEIIIYFSY